MFPPCVIWTRVQLCVWEKRLVLVRLFELFERVGPIITVAFPA